MSKRVRRTNLLNTNYIAMALVNTFLLHFRDSLSQHLELSVSSQKSRCLFIKRIKSIWWPVVKKFCYSNSTLTIQYLL